MFHRAEIKKRAKAQIKGNVLTLFLCNLIIGIILMITMPLLGAGLLIFPALSISGVIIYLSLTQNVRPKIGDIFKGFGMFGKALWLCIITTFFKMAWSLLFVIPGIIKGYAYSMAPYILADNPEMTAREALRESKKLTKGYKGQLFIMQLSFIGWFMLAPLTFGLLFIWLGPYIGATYANAYLALKGGDYAETVNINKRSGENNKDDINYGTHELFVLPYKKSALPVYMHVFAGIIGYAAGFAVLWLFYRQIVFAIIGAMAFVPAIIVMNIGAAKKKRLNNLLRQFQNFLDSLVVSLQAGKTDLGAMESAIGDLELMYSPKADIVKEIKLIVKKFGNRQSIGEALTDFAERSGLEDIGIFAEIYTAVEGKGAKTREIVVRTQKILSDKIEIEAEIKTIISSAVMELNIISIIPILIVAIMGFMGGEMMEGLFTPTGHVIATIAILIFVGAYLLGRKLANIKI